MLLNSIMDSYKITFNTWNKIAKLYEEHFMDLHLYDNSYDLFCQQLLGECPKVLEIGCGPGNITKYLLSRKPEIKILATDIAPKMLELVEKNCPEAELMILDCRDIDQLSNKFEGIVCGFCMPYLSKDDTEKFIKNSSSLLQEQGVLYFSTLEGNYETSGFETGSTGDEMYVYYHQEDFLTKKLEVNNFEILQVIHKKFKNSKGENQIHLIYLAKKAI